MAHIWVYSSGHVGQENKVKSFVLGIGDDYFPSPLLPSSSATHAVERYTGPYSPPGLMGGGGRRCSLAPARKKGLWGLLFLPSDSIYMGSSGLHVYYATQAGCEEL